jgi:hypothetical protein
MRMPIYVAGTVLLAIAAFALGRISGPSAALEPRTPPPVRQQDIARLSTADLGAVIMARVGRNFVDDYRGAPAGENGITFYGQPKPYGTWLCRVPVYRIPAKVMTGKLERPQDFGQTISNSA